MATYLHKFIVPSVKKLLMVQGSLSPRTQVIRCMSDNIGHPSDLDNPPIPEYKARVNEGQAVKKARLLYQSRKRGMLENGLLLSTFADDYLDKLTGSQLDEYDTLINKPTNDWDIYNWIICNKETPQEYDTEVMALLKEHAKNKERVMRNQQPPLKFQES